MNLWDLSSLPLILLLLAGVVGRQPKRNVFWCYLAALPTLAASAWGWWRHFPIEPLRADGLLFGVLGTLLLSWPKNVRLLRSLGWAGTISYALYVCHYPVLWLFGLVSNPPIGGEYYLRCSAAIVVSLLLAMFLEYAVQPFVAKWFKGPRRA